MKRQGLRLWQKIYLVTLALVICSLSAACAFLIDSSLSNMISREEDTAGRTHAYLASSVQNTVLYEQLRQNKQSLSRQELANVFQSALGGQSQAGVSIYQSGNRIYSYRSAEAKAEKALIPQNANSGRYRLTQHAQDGKTLLLVYSKEQIQNDSYDLISSTDITAVYVLHRQQTIRLLVIAAASAVGIAILLALVIQKLWSPLTRMNREVKQIARGEYRRRLPVKRRDELGELSENMNRMAASIQEKVCSLEQVAQNRKLFIDNLTHEMKTPLTTILGYADMLRITQDLPEDKRRDYSGMIVEEAKRLQALSGKLMELISMDAFAEENRTVLPVRELLKKAASAILPLYESRGIALAVQSEEFSLAVDPELFQSMLVNLLDNAAKASRPGQEVTLSALLRDGLPVVAVADQGIGIPPDKISQITEPFFMVDKARSRKSGGAGLGLALCARIAQLHGARLTIHSRVGGGTCVAIEFQGGETTA